MKFTDRQTETLFLLSIIVAGALLILGVAMDPYWNRPQPNAIRFVSDVQNMTTEPCVGTETHVVGLTSARSADLPPR